MIFSCHKKGQKSATKTQLKPSYCFFSIFKAVLEFMKEVHFLGLPTHAFPAVKGLRTRPPTQSNPLSPQKNKKRIFVQSQLFLLDETTSSDDRFLGFSLEVFLKEKCRDFILILMDCIPLQ